MLTNRSNSTGLLYYLLARRDTVCQLNTSSLRGWSVKVRTSLESPHLASTFLTEFYFLAFYNCLSTYYAKPPERSQTVTTRFDMAVPSPPSQNLQRYHHDPPTKPTLLSLPPKLRLQILTHVLRLPQPIKHTCLYSLLCLDTTCALIERRHLAPKRVNSTQPEIFLERERLQLANPKPPFWAVLLSNKQIYTEARGLVMEVNAVHLRDLRSSRGFRRAPLSTIWVMGPPRPETDQVGVRTIVMDIAHWVAQPGLQKHMQAWILLLALRPFKRLRTVYLRLTVGGPSELQTLDRMLRQFAGLLKFEADAFVVSDGDAQGGRRACREGLRIGVIGAERAAWLCRMPVAAVRACARVSMKRRVFN